MLMPKRVKHRRVHRGRMKGVATKGNTVTYGDYGLIATECGWITSNQIEAARIAMTRSVKRGGKVYIKIFPHKSVTKKPAEVRMGSGKGAPEYWVAVVKPGRVMFEIGDVTEEQAREAIRLAGHKLPVKTKSHLFNLPSSYALSRKMLIEPRIKANWQYRAEHLSINLRAGYGMENKLPTLDHLYPDKIYRDFMVLNAYMQNPELDHLITYTYIHNPENPAIREKKLLFCATDS